MMKRPIPRIVRAWAAGVLGRYGRGQGIEAQSEPSFMGLFKRGG